MTRPIEQQDTPSQRRWICLCHWLWQGLRFFWGTVLLGLLLNMVANVLNLEDILRWLHQNLAIALSLSISLPVFTLLTGIVSHKNATSPPHPSSRLSAQQNRAEFVRALSSQYKSELAQSLQGAAPQPLVLHEKFDMTRSPSLTLRHADRLEYSLPPGTSILQVYKEAGHGLLVLGAPGAGKTTLLLELAHALWEQLEHDTSQRLPVMLNLSSWSTKRQPLNEWLVEELQLRYLIPRSLGRQWIQEDQLVLLLDGFDEVASAARENCIDAINHYHEAHPLPMVICSRTEVYLSQRHRLALQRSVIVQPLTKLQVDAYLKQLGKPLAAVREALKNNKVLYDLITTPLMLRVVILAYQGLAAENLPQMGSAEEQQQQIFASYVRRMLGQGTTRMRYTSYQTVQWLIWLAKQMVRHNQTEFYIERMQPDWLALESQAYHMYRVIVRLVAGLFVGLFIGPLIGLFYSSFVGIVVGLIGWLVGGLVGWLFSRFVRQSGREIKLVEGVDWSGRGWRTESVKSPRMLLIGVIFSGLIGSLTVGLSIGLIGGPVDGLISGIGIGMLSILFSWLSMGLLSGMSRTAIRESDRIVPNQGIRRSLKNSLLTGLGFGLVGGLIIGLAVSLTSELVTGHPASLNFELSFGLCGGLVSGLGAAMPNGGLACIQHSVLRLLLWHARSIPLNYSRFLDYTADHILLYKIGGGYSFIHPLFLNYFASLDPAVISSPSRQTLPQTPCILPSE